MYSEEYLRKAEKRYIQLYYAGPLGYTNIPIKNTNIIATVVRRGQSGLEYIHHDNFDIRVNDEVIATDLTMREMVIKLLELKEEK